MNTLQAKPFNILLIGDDCLDVYQFGTVDRISPEAPVPVFNFCREEHRPGMAGNVLTNLQALGCRVEFLHGDTSTKTRLIDTRSKQHIVRIDKDAECSPIEFVTAIPPLYDAVVISDYNKGTVTYDLIQEVRQGFHGPVFVDTKKTDLAQLEGCIVKINKLEHSRVISECSDLIVTLGDRGATWNDIHFTAKKVDVADVCGAGDTFLASLCYKYLESNGDMVTAINFAIRASAIAVQHLGVYAPRSEEHTSELQSH